MHLKAHKSIPIEVLKAQYWRKIELHDGTVYWVHKKREASILYYPQTGKWAINGKIMTLLHDTQVSNVDDVYEVDLQKIR